MASILIERRTDSVHSRRAKYRDWQTQELKRQAIRYRDTHQHHGSHRDQFMDCGLDL
ncbi:hypothetical protein [Mycolicibacterium porcinum]|uniref:hypothetical protein n=1 Tax=Mycolicibacterium porcinum TaxID=39693 RepID=UPI0013F4EC66|nr:hypothetical protein [Mycolicibacterium porcinum]